MLITWLFSDQKRYKKLHKFSKTTLMAFKDTSNEIVFKNDVKHLLEERTIETNIFNKRNWNTPMEIDTSKYMTDVHYEDRIDSNQIMNRKKVPRLLIDNKTVPFLKESICKTAFNSFFIFCCRLLKISLLFFIPILLSTMLCVFLKPNEDYVDRPDFTNITKDLHNSLYGQDEIIIKLEYNLNLIKNNKVFLFFGGVGVGKTFMSQIIERNFPFKNNIQKFILCSDERYKNLEEKIISGLVHNEHNLIIIDDLPTENIYLILPLINNLSATDDKFILIIIFNNLGESLIDFTQGNYHTIKYKAKDISNIFSSNNIIHSTYVFKDLTASDVKSCIRSALKKRGKYESEKIVNKILEYINYQYSGCKGVHAKIGLLLNNM